MNVPNNNLLGFFFVLLFGLIFSAATLAQSGQGFKAGAVKSCAAGYEATWIISRACDLGGGLVMQADDAIDIQCDDVTGRWSADFYQEPVGADTNTAISQATRHAVCPGNGYITKAEDGRAVLRCDFWQATNNVSKQLEFELLPSTRPGIREMRWLSREVANPNVVCGISGRPEGGRDTGSGGHSIVEH